MNTKPFDLDAALDALGRDALAGSPRPGPDLIARVLADAADVAPAQTAEVAPSTQGAAPEGRWLDALFGWTSGALATMALCFAIGVGVGLEAEIDIAELPILGGESEELMFAESDFLQDEIL